MIPLVCSFFHSHDIRRITSPNALRTRLKLPPNTHVMKMPVTRQTVETLPCKYPVCQTYRGDWTLVVCRGPASSQPKEHCCKRCSWQSCFHGMLTDVLDHLPWPVHACGQTTSPISWWSWCGVCCACMAQQCSCWPQSGPIVRKGGPLRWDACIGHSFSYWLQSSQFRQSCCRWRSLCRKSSVGARSQGESQFAKSRDASRRCDVLLQPTMWIALLQSSRWEWNKRFVQFCITENHLCDAMHFTAICALLAEIHCAVGHNAGMTASAMPRCGELRGEWNMHHAVVVTV